MSLAVVFCRGSLGIEAPLVTVEAHLSNGIPNFSIVGLPEAAVKESKDRVRSAIINSYYEFPAKRITVNLAPADLPKEGGRYDLPIALGILAATQQIPTNSLSHYEFGGELALSGDLRPFRGALPFALAVRNTNRAIILSDDNAKEISFIDELSILSAKHLKEVVDHLTQKKQLIPVSTTNLTTHATQKVEPDFSEICGQTHAKRALEIAAAGGHNLLMMGPPGTGKTLLASALPGILPPLSLEESLQVRAIYSLNTQTSLSEFNRIRPFRSPHHTASGVALVGGGAKPKPGEISLAHLGILFLDEFPEFDRRVLEVLREPLEAGSILISRAAQKIEYPAKFQLIAAMNPCPCGYLGDPTENCRCTQEQVRKYRSRISGPLLDRIDLHIEVPRLTSASLTIAKTQLRESSEEVLVRVLRAFEKQIDRSNVQNARLTLEELEKIAKLNDSIQVFAQNAIEKLNLSARAYHRLLRVARTIADLEGSLEIEINHVKEALSYRFKGFNYPL